MKQNIGAFDGVIRMILGTLIIFYTVLYGPWWLAFFSLIPYVTATMIYCPLYDVAGISTNDEVSDNNHS